MGNLENFSRLEKSTTAKLEKLCKYFKYLQFRVVDSSFEGETPNGILGRYDVSIILTYNRHVIMEVNLYQIIDLIEDYTKCESYSLDIDYNYLPYYLYSTIKAIVRNLQKEGIKMDVII